MADLVRSITFEETMKGLTCGWIILASFFFTVQQECFSIFHKSLLTVNDIDFVLDG